MPKQCLFCDSSVDSVEHIWSKWILQELKPTQAIRVQIRRRVDKYVDNPEAVVKCVCQGCNGGWMSALEVDNIPHMREMLHDRSILLNPVQQKSLARWAVLKAMVIEAVNRQRTLFYDDSERLGLKPPSPFLPVGTMVWIGRYSRKGFHAGGTDIWGDIDGTPKAMHGAVTSIVVGHLVIQVLTAHVIPKFGGNPVRPKCKPGAWDASLLNIWPIFGSVRWPPPLSFTHGGSDSLGILLNRWKIGTDVGATIPE